MTCCSNISNVFSKSSLSTTTSFFEWWHWCRYSNDQTIQSWMDLFFMKPYWFLWTIHWMNSYILFSINLVINLIGVFSNEMGLKSFTLTGLLTLGISAMKVLMITSKTMSPSWKSWQSLCKSCLLICHHVLRNLPLKSLDSGALLRGRLQTKLSISSRMKGSIKHYKFYTGWIRYARSKSICGSLEIPILCLKLFPTWE